MLPRQETDSLKGKEGLKRHAIPPGAWWDEEGEDDLIGGDGAGVEHVQRKGDERMGVVGVADGLARHKRATVGNGVGEQGGEVGERERHIQGRSRGGDLVRYGSVREAKAKGIDRPD